MATRSRTTFKKRQKELARMEKQRDKAARRMQRKQEKLLPPVEGELEGELAAQGATEAETAPGEAAPDIAEVTRT